MRNQTHRRTDTHIVTNRTQIIPGGTGKRRGVCAYNYACALRCGALAVCVQRAMHHRSTARRERKRPCGAIVLLSQAGRARPCGRGTAYGKVCAHL